MDSRAKEYQSAATAAVCLWHLCKMFDDNAQFFFAKRINGIDFSVNVGFAYQKFMLMRSSRHGPGPLGVAAEVAAVGAAGAVVASVVARPRPRQPPRSLDVASIEMPAAGIEARGDVTFFTVRVTPRSSAGPWTVMRRYNDFNALQQELGTPSQSFPDAPFPKKTGLRSCKGQALEARRRGLEVWIWRAVEHKSSSSAWLETVQHFLEDERQAVAGGNLQPVVMEAPPDAAAPPDDGLLEAPTQPCNTAGGEDDSLFQIQIPDGVQPGQFLSVGIPVVRQITVQIPEGATSGGTLELLYDPTAGKLTPIT